MTTPKTMGCELEPLLASEDDGAAVVVTVNGAAVNGIDVP